MASGMQVLQLCLPAQTSAFLTAAEHKGTGAAEDDVAPAELKVNMRPTKPVQLDRVC